MTQREMFEKWYNKKTNNNGGVAYYVELWGDYCHEDIQLAWEAWQAACPEGNTPVNGNLLNALRASINGDCYMGTEWEVATIDSMIGKH